MLYQLRTSAAQEAFRAPGLGDASTATYPRKPRPSLGQSDARLRSPSQQNGNEPLHGRIARVDIAEVTEENSSGDLEELQRDAYAPKHIPQNPWDRLLLGRDDVLQYLIKNHLFSSAFPCLPENLLEEVLDRPDVVQYLKQPGMLPRIRAYLSQHP
ncbi:MAG: hypothetical protein LBF94_04345 [Puniceicoccales bacterium]|jgi:hypothetical protein|nr:hypothetical protein [Puniceicoccales bacterium]